MKFFSEYCSDDVHFIKENRPFMIHEAAFHLEGYANNENRNALHSFIVDWQIPEIEYVVKA